MRRTGKMVLACLLAASAMLTACGGSGDTGSAGSAGTTTQAAAIGGESRLSLIHISEPTRPY